MTIITKENQHLIKDIPSLAPDSGVIINIDKELNWTSFNVVGKLRSIVQIKKIGHAGTLDPLATGLLILAIGKATKSIDKFQGMPKIYSGKIKLGFTTETDDSETIEENPKPYSHITPENIEEIKKTFLGELQQLPPKYSAKKVKGKRLYKYARQNKEVEIKPSTVFVHKFEITEINLPYLSFEIETSKGTYIRAIARDFGNKLETGAYLSELRRESIGEYNVKNALSISDIEKIFFDL